MSKVRKSGMILFAAIAACAITLVGLVGCGESTDEAKSAEEVYTHYSQNPHDNFIMDGDIKAGVSAQGMTMEIPLKLHAETSKGNTYVETTVSMFGTESTDKSYIVKEDNEYVSYSCSTSSTDTTENWTRDVVVEDAQAVEKFTNLEKSVFEGADFAKNENGYIVDIPLSKMMTTIKDAAEADGTEIEEMFNTLNSMGVNPDNIKITYSFDKDYHLTKISLPEIEVPFDSEGVTGTVKLSCDINLNNHNNVQNIVVPEDIINKAKSPDSFIDDTASALIDNAEKSNNEKASDTSSTTNSTVQKKNA